MGAHQNLGGTDMRTWTVATLLLLGLAVASCSSDDVAGADGTGSNGDEAGVELECETEGYPCSLSEVSMEIHERTDEVGNDALAMLETGSSVEEVQAWLAEQQGVAEVEFDDHAIRYRLDGGRGAWILRESAVSSRGSPGSRSVVPSVASMQSGSFFHVAGPDTDAKRALVLSPMLWDFGGTDDGAAVAAILNNTRGYEGRVTYAANASVDDTVVGVSSFTGWEGYQVVHVVSHGTRLCTDGKCRAVIFASTLQGEAPQGRGISTVSEIKAGLGQRGLETAKVEGSRGLDLELDYVVLSADFFRAQPAGALDDTLIFFNACEVSGGATDLGDALRGTTSVFLGWDENVSSTTAAAAAVALYTDLSEGGYPADIAFDRLSGNLKTDSLLSEHAQLVLSDRKDGDQLRIRDVVELLDPEGALLEATSSVPIIGQQDDGEEDLAPYSVQVDGMTPEIADGAMLHVSIDGVESDPQPITDGTSNEMDQWLVSGEIPLGYDLEDDKVVDFRAWVELPGGGESDDETPGTLTGSEPIMGYEWEYVGTNELGFPGGRLNVSSATLTLEFEEGQAFDEPHPRYVVTDGTVTYGSRDGSALGCTYSGGGTTYTVAADSARGALIFDTTATPVQFTGVLSTSGPDDTVTQDCTSIGPGYSVNTVSYGPNTVWLNVETGSELPVAERRSIDANVVFPSEYGYRHVFTITRTR